MIRSKEEFLRGLTVAELRAAHWRIARELVRRGEPVALVLPGEPEAGEPFGERGRSPVLLPGLGREMARRGTTGRELARRSGVSKEAISDARHGLHRTQRAKAEALANALEVSLERLRTPSPGLELLPTTKADEKGAA